MLPTSRKEKSNILRYWESVEYFTPNNLPKLAPRDNVNPVYQIYTQERFPWEPGHAHLKKPIRRNACWKYSVFLNPVNVGFLRADIEARIGTVESDTARDERAPAHSALFVVNVDRHGVFVPGSFLTATIGWAYGEFVNARSAANLTLEDFERFASDMAYLYEERYAGYQATFDTIEALSSELASCVSLPPSALREGEYHVSARMVNLDSAELAREKKRHGLRSDNGLEADDEGPEVPKEPPPTDILNSRLIGELSSVATEVEKGNAGAALYRYLGDKPNKQIDLRRPLDVSWNILNPRHFPQGRWPGKGRFPLVYSQQVAVNLVFNRLAPSSGLMAVNGPPGTGKTTLLKDIVAGIVTQRAKALSQFKDPNHAFLGNELAYRKPKRDITYSPLHGSLLGFGIAVASSNNGAVENVVNEFPVKDDVDDERSTRSSIFTDLASDLLGKEAWTLISAKLGKKSNRNNFVSAFWFEDTSKQSSNEEGIEEEPRPSRAQRLLKTSSLGLSDWQAAVANFNKALAKEEALRKERVALHEGVLKKLRGTKRVNALIEAHRDHETNFRDAKQRFEETSSNVSPLRLELGIKNDRLERLRKNAPGGFFYAIHRFFKLRRILDWEAEMEQTEEGLLSLSRQIAAAEDAANKAKQAYHRASQSIVEHQKALDEAQKEVRELNAAAERYKHQHSASYPDIERLNADLSYRETFAPFADDLWESARVAVFMAALDLHEVFLQVARRPVMKNLSLTIDIINGQAPGNMPSKAAAHAWETFFMLVPMVSSTFASFHVQFAHLQSEDLGWLLIDEAGQAAPPQAAPALWRSRRALVVGDPLQLTPIVAAPFTLQESLRQLWRVGPEWAPSKGSAQTLADNASEYGSYIDKLWVGAPLVVHRRCDEPMFSLCNVIAYDNAMVNGKPGKYRNTGLKSQWIHVSGTEASDHWLTEEGVALDKLLARLVEAGIAPNDIFLISPFRSVVQELTKRAKGALSELQAGTIHTVQGKEASVVILVLGGNPERHGAKQWASEEPNLLNVAASRSKQYLYVIGNRDEWAKYPYFSDAAVALA